MRCKLICLMLASVGLWCGCQKAAVEAPPNADVLFRWHFAGDERLAGDTNAARWVAWKKLPATRVLQEQTLRKLAKAPRQFLERRIAATTNNYAEFIQPLLDGLTRAESCAELRGGTNPTPEFALAVRLDTTAAGIWSTNLSLILSAWTGAQPDPIQVRGNSGWELKKHHAPNLIQFLRAGEWIVVSCGQDQLPLQAEWLKRISDQGRPLEATNEFWLEVSADWPRLEPHLPAPLPVHLPQTHLTLTGSGENLRTKIDLIYADPVRQTFEPWRIPTNTIREPLVSFTAGRGLAPWLNQFKEVQQLNPEPVPDQFYLWALADIPFQTFLAFPNRNPTNFLERLAADLTGRFGGNLREHGRGSISWSTNTGQLAWQGLLFIVPFLEPVLEPGGQFLLAGLFPNTPKPKPPPAGLLEQVTGRTNLVYYDWEITQPRLTQCRGLGQLVQIVFDQKVLGTNAAAMRWLSAIAPELGNSVTEISVTGPKQLTLVRKSPIGLTAMELAALANWLESPKFPLGDYRLPPRTNATESVPAGNSSDAETRR